MAVNSNDLLTPANMLEVKESIEKAKEDTTPHVGVAGDELFVIGDANKIEPQVHNYTVTVIWDRERAEKYGIRKEDIVKENDTHVAFEVEYKNVTIVPMNRLKINAAVATILPWFVKFKEDGSAEDMSSAELVAVAREMSDEILRSMYDFVGAVLDVEKDVYKYFEYGSVIHLTTEMLVDFPDIVNEMDF